MNTEVGTIEFRFGIQPQSHNLLKHAIHHQATDQGHSHSAQRADHLRCQADAADSTQRLGAENAGGNAAPGTA